jgi:hypothetical protein
VDHLVSNLKDFGVGLKAVRGGIDNHPGGNFSFPSQLFPKEFWQVSVKLNSSCGRGLAVSSGITIGTLKEAAIGNIDRGNSLEAAKIALG